jgi:hypothetical protein
MISITTVQTEADVSDILALQQVNLRRNVPIDEQNSEGFVTVEHRPDVLWRMNQAAPSIIVKNAASELIGYALVMLPQFVLDVPQLDYLFSLINRLEYKGKLIEEYAYYVMGQGCVAKRYRGQKIFAQMLLMHRELYSHRYQLLLTSISSKNKRSLRAHTAVGFETIHLHYDPVLDETWHIVLWDWQK